MLHNQDKHREQRVLASHIIVFCNTFTHLISCLLLFKIIPLLMQEHNPSLIPIIVAEDSRKIERSDESKKAENDTKLRRKEAR